MQDLLQKPEGKRPLRRPRPRWGDNIQMGFQEKGRGHRLNWSGSRYGHVAVLPEHGDDVWFL